MTRTTWRSICHARAVTIALSLVRQSMDLGRANPNRRLSRDQNTNRATKDISRIDKYVESISKTTST